MSENETIENILVEKINADLREFLKEGNRIRTKFVTGSEWINNTITFVGPDMFEMHLKVSYVMNNISKGDALTFKYGYENLEYVMDGVVEEINLYENLITIRVYNIQKFTNRRKDIRFDVSLCSYVVYDYTQKPTYALIQNLSKGGLSLETKSDLDIGATCGVNIFLSKEKIIFLVCKVLRKKSNENNSVYDTQITSINRKSQDLFDQLLHILGKYDDELFFNYITSLNKS